MPKEKLTRREREKRRQRQEIMNAARVLFSRKGYHHVTMHEIAETAEFAIGTLYSFFNNKEDLYKTIIEDMADKLHEALENVLKTPDDEIQKLRNYVRVKAGVLKQNLLFIRVFLTEDRGMSYNVRSGLREKLRARYKGTIQHLASVFDSGMKRNLFNRVSKPYHLAIAMDSAINAFLIFYLDDPEGLRYLDDPDSILNIFFEALLTKKSFG